MYERKLPLHPQQVGDIALMWATHNHPFQVDRITAVVQQRGVPVSRPLLAAIVKSFESNSAARLLTLLQHQQVLGAPPMFSLDLFELYHRIGRPDIATAMIAGLQRCGVALSAAHYAAVFDHTVPGKDRLALYREAESAGVFAPLRVPPLRSSRFVRLFSESLQPGHAPAHPAHSKAARPGVADAVSMYRKRPLSNAVLYEAILAARALRRPWVVDFHACPPAAVVSRLVHLLDLLYEERFVAGMSL
jgi:hypothetical protein